MRRCSRRRTTPFTLYRALYRLITSRPHEPSTLATTAVKVTRCGITLDQPVSALSTHAGKSRAAATHLDWPVVPPASKKPLEPHTRAPAVEESHHNDSCAPSASFLQRCFSAASAAAAFTAAMAAAAKASSRHTRLDLHVVVRHACPNVAHDWTS